MRLGVCFGWVSCDVVYEWGVGMSHEYEIVKLAIDLAMLEQAYLQWILPSGSDRPERIDPKGFIEEARDLLLRAAVKSN